MPMRRGVGLAIGAALFLLVGRLAAGVYADYQWYAALDAVDAWQLRVINVSVLRTLAFVVGGGFAFVNLWAIRRSVASVILPRRLGNIEIGEEVPGSLLLGAVLAGSLVCGVAFAVPAADWMSFVLAQVGSAVNEADPYVRADIGVWMFWFPFEHAVQRWLTLVVSSLTIVVVLLYAMTPSLRWGRGELLVTAWVRRHFALLAAAALVLLGWMFRLDAFDLLLNGTGPGGAFSAADQQFGIPVATILAYACVGAAFVVGWAGWSGQPRLALAVLTIILLLTPTLRWVVPNVVGLTGPSVDAEESVRAYEATRAGFTRRAFALDRIRLLPESLTARSALDIAGLPVWDPAVLSRAIGRSRGFGGLVGAMPVVVGPTGATLLTVAAPAVTDGTTPPDDRWTILRTLAATTDARGGVLHVDAMGRFPENPESVGSAVVWDGARGSAVVEGTASGVAGAPLDDALVRLAAAWSQQDLRLLGAAEPGSVLVRRRDVRERVQALVPFLMQGTTVVPIVDGDSLVWSVELFTVSRSFPLSRPLTTSEGPVRYLAHAATAFVAARTGRVTIVPVSDAEADPILRAWLKKLPRTLGATRVIPRSIAEQLPPVVSGAEWQAEVFAAVGLRGDAGRRRHIPALDGSDTVLASRHHTPTWWSPLTAGAWTQPVLQGDDALSGVLVATGGRERALFWHPLADTTRRWSTSLDSLAAEGGAGNAVVAGRVRAIPLAGGALTLVQPFYNWPREGAPQVRRVAVHGAEGLRGGASLAAALGAPATQGPVPADSSDVAARARELYDALRTALQRGDWLAFGSAFDALGTLLERPRR
jgi:uncharacterized membrane protein (UPF0182 family)